MRRKLIKLGPSTLVISMPKKWTNKLKLKEGDEIDIDETGSTLILTGPQKMDISKTTTYNLDKIPTLIVHEMVVGMYKTGLGDITFTNLSKDKSKEIKDVVSDVMGFEIISSSKNSCRINDIGIAQEVHLRRAEQQIYWKLLQMIDEVINLNADEKDVRRIDKEINRLAFFIQRKIGYYFATYNKAFLIYEKITLLENLGDSLYLYKLYTKKSEIQFELLKKVGKIIDKIRSLETKRDVQTFAEIKKDIEEGKKSALANQKNNKSFFAIEMLFDHLEHLLENLISLNIKDLEEKFE